MEIILRGRAPAEFKYDGKCSTCNSVLKADNSELVHTNCQREGDMHMGLCPVCESRVWFTRERF